jgi:hypothetical protein
MKPLQSLRLAITIVMVGLVVILGVRTEARSPIESSSAKIVTGEVLQVEGGFRMARDLQGDTLDIVDKSYVITDQSGKEVRLELSEDTEVQERVNPGDKIEAKISPEGHTLSVTRLEP